MVIGCVRNGQRDPRETKIPATVLSEKDSRKNVHEDFHGQVAQICQSLSMVLGPRALQSKSTGSKRKLQTIPASRRQPKIWLSRD